MNNVAMNILVHVFGGHMHSHLCISMYRIAASYGVYFFHFLRYCQTIFQSGYVNLYSHWQSMKISVAPYSCQYLVLMLSF